MASEYVLRSVSGAGVSGDEAGVDPADNQPEFRHTPTANDVPLTVVPTSEFAGRRFDRCPICLEPDPSEREHVPPHALGGQVQTFTCSSCNSRLGSYVEDDLRAWHAGELRNVRMSSPESGVRGRRTVRQVYYRTAVTGEFALVVLQRMTPDERQMMDSREILMELGQPERSSYHLGALKQAYLAACMQLHTIPPNGSAAAIRRDLVAARDAPDRRSLPPSAIADALTVARSFTQLQVSPLVMCTFKGESVAESTGILLAGALLVSWPFPDVPPRPSV